MTDKRNSVKGAELPVQVRHFDELPESALVPVRAVSILLGLTAHTVYNQTSAGKLPRPVMRGVYRVGDIRKVLAGQWIPESGGGGGADDSSADSGR